MAARKYQSASEMAETDSIIYRKLMFESAGNDDSRLIKMTKAFSNWCSMEDKRNITATYKGLVKNLDRMQFDAKRTCESVHTMEKIKSEYAKITEKLQEDIELTKMYIKKESDLKEELKNKRADRVQYQHLVTLVLSKPDRKSVEFKVEKLTEELMFLQGRLEKIQVLMSEKRKELTGLMQIASDLAGSITQIDELNDKHSRLKDIDDLLKILASTPEQSTSSVSMMDIDDDKAANNTILISEGFGTSGISFLEDHYVDIQSDDEVPYVLQIQEPEIDGLYDNIIEPLIAVKSLD